MRLDAREQHKHKEARVHHEQHIAQQQLHPWHAHKFQRELMVSQRQGRLLALLG
jgi:hypothetical protein